MKSTVAAGAAALIASIGAAAAEPMVLTDAQLDKVTAGAQVDFVRALPGPEDDRVPASLSIMVAAPSFGTSRTQRPAEFVIITIGQKTLETPPGQ